MADRRSRKTHVARAVLLFADTERSADQLYFTGFRVPDPFIAMQIGRRKIGVLNALEFGRALKESDLDEVLPLEEWNERAKKRLRVERPGPGGIIATVARYFGVRAFRVPDEFPVGAARQMLEHGVHVEPANGPLFHKREIKTPAQARAVAEGNRRSALGFAATTDLLRRATIHRDGRLMLDGRVLTSERVREAIEIACLRAGAVSLDTIVAGGDQACDPHCRGNGPLRARELIIVDIFPRVTATGYHGDMTRTFLKGTPTDAQAKLVAAVRSAQKHALTKIRAGAIGRRVHESVVAHFESLGYKTKHGPKGSVGFFHGTGHGLGLAVHEPPGLGKLGGHLRKGAVVTVEPGLYYPGLGGCRIEDVVQVTRGAPRMLSKFPYTWIIA